ncbi:MAG: type III toxin-antitoxin system ToxN/AbiQ family toxin [Eubacterium sp.]|nr:type III toxin-antitoxin system ToxN/AbiQ family toxin [Eubacterium sp.]
MPGISSRRGRTTNFPESCFFVVPPGLPGAGRQQIPLNLAFLLFRGRKKRYPPHRADDKVSSVSPQIGKNTRVYVGVLAIMETHKYIIPLSHPQEKHYGMRPSADRCADEVTGSLPDLPGRE